MFDVVLALVTLFFLVALFAAGYAAFQTARETRAREEAARLEAEKRAAEAVQAQADEEFYRGYESARRALHAAASDGDAHSNEVAAQALIDLMSRQPNGGGPAYLNGDRAEAREASTPTAVLRARTHLFSAGRRTDVPLAVRAVMAWASETRNECIQVPTRAASALRRLITSDITRALLADGAITAVKLRRAVPDEVETLAVIREYGDLGWVTDTDRIEMMSRGPQWSHFVVTAVVAGKLGPAADRARLGRQIVAEECSARISAGSLLAVHVPAEDFAALHPEWRKLPEYGRLRELALRYLSPQGEPMRRLGRSSDELAECCVIADRDMVKDMIDFAARAGFLGWSDRGPIIDTRLQKFEQRFPNWQNIPGVSDRLATFICEQFLASAERGVKYERDVLNILKSKGRSLPRNVLERLALVDKVMQSVSDQDDGQMMVDRHLEAAKSPVGSATRALIGR